ncbi:MAG TPA: ABC transporter ATP-binding protein [Alphaproteobacteria bacterium]|nr:ABC transporter ATP-binding protein [Alphaproteobacteria bacterium]
MSAPVLDIRGLSKSFGALQVARDITLSLEAGARQALIGPNGAGKTSLVNLITGFLKPSHGSVHLHGEDVTRLSQAERARRGIARTFQINQLFRGLSAIENLCLVIGERTGACDNLWRPAGSRREVIDEAMALLDLFGLTGEALRPVRELPYGRQRLVEIAIALGQRPQLLLLDEPAAGVPSAESHVILEAINRLDKEIAVLIIEHDMDLVFRFAQRITVLVAGAVLTEGTPQEIAADARVREVYLGEGVPRG